jgi:hypothetical protein
MYLDDWERVSVEPSWPVSPAVPAVDPVAHPSAPALRGQAPASPPAPAPQIVPGANAAGDDLPTDFPRPGTPEWRATCARRGLLIRKDLGGEITDEERAELERLERRSELSLARWGFGSGVEG